MRLRHFIAIAFAFTVPTLAAHAATYLYTFQYMYHNSNDGRTISFEEPLILTTDTTILPSAFQFSDNDDVISLEIDPTSGACTLDTEGLSCVEVNFVKGLAKAAFGGTPLDSVGTFEFPGSFLTIADITPPSTVPEPSSIALLGTGLLGVIGAARRRLKA